MSLTQINNGDSGLVARTAINNAISAIDALNTSASVQTTNGATTSIATLSMGTYSVYSISAEISGWDSTNSYAYGAELFGVFKNVSGTVTQISTTDVYEKSNFATASTHIIVDTHPKIVVVGESGKTINWTVNYKITKI